MSLHALDIPESTRDLANWLEGHLVGLHLGTLVAELMAVNTDAPHRPLEELLGGDLPRLLRDGLQGLSREKLCLLLQHPTLLLELQERVVIEGGRYWEQRAQGNTEVQTHVSAGWQRLQSAIAAPQALATAAPTPVANAGKSSRRVWLLLAATAALVAVGVTAAWQLNTAGPPAVAWGWAKPGALPNDAGSPETYLETLANGADEWFRKPPSSKESLAIRLAEFRQGCDALLAAPHRPLAEADKAWLLERCRAWRDKIEGHLNDLNATGDVEKVRADADETARKLVNALRERTVA